MALYNHAGYAETLYAVRVDRTLCKPLGISYLLCFRVEHLNEVAAYDLTLLLRVGNTFKVLEELVACVNTYHVKSKSLVSIHNFGKLVLAQHSVVNEDTRKVTADCTVQQCRTNRRVYTTAQTEYYSVIAQLLFQLLYSSLNKRCGAPLLLAAANVYNEI